MDWLEQFIHLRIHWKDKWLLMSCRGKLNVLQGKVQRLDQLDMLHVMYLLQSDTNTSLPIDLDPIISLVL
jgi:hypothetical protein